MFKDMILAIFLKICYFICMVDLILKSFYLILPAYLANMAPVIFAKAGLLKFAAKPIDGGKKFGGDFIFGAGKTWRGIVAAIIGGLIIAGLQAFLYGQDFFRQISLINYPVIWPLFGLLAGLGAILGDLAKSFFKRRAGIASGRSWPVFDQLDFVAGFFVFTYFFVRPSWEIIVTAAFMTLILHPLTNLIAYLLKIKKVWW
jgi:CDP-2,3-bis-(O-geranylgeranyl)-sn-glycerol synthase